mmetsp:Transcript_16514/g.42374  ORF Transcript_16514/g.42374 Transcript_16514/m.42374 type:complete len:221 (-) Transcript_16514:546-1208(-)
MTGFRSSQRRASLSARSLAVSRGIRLASQQTARTCGSPTVATAVCPSFASLTASMSFAQAAMDPMPTSSVGRRASPYSMTYSSLLMRATTASPCSMPRRWHGEGLLGRRAASAANCSTRWDSQSSAASCTYATLTTIVSKSLMYPAPAVASASVAPSCVRLAVMATHQDALSNRPAWHTTAGAACWSLKRVPNASRYLPLRVRRCKCCRCQRLDASTACA